MKLTRLEDIKLHKLEKVTLPDGERTEQPDEGVSYQALIQYLDDEVATATYGADVDKVHRVATIRNEMEDFLLPLVENKSGNVSNYIIEYNGNMYSILRVTPRYVDMAWR